jgi:nucleoid DNA-binding protein
MIHKNVVPIVHHPHLNPVTEVVMVNFDYPDVCLSGADEQCQLTPPDLDVLRERVHKLPEGFTKTMVRSLVMAFPDKFKSDEEAYMVYDAMKAVIGSGLANGRKVHLEGLGEFSTEKEAGKARVVFSPEASLNQAV